MDKIASFNVDHNSLEVGLYLSRKDGNVFTYDLRMKRPNCGDYLTNGTIHTIEHIFACAIREGEAGSKVVYFGPMGCRTGFCLLLFDTELLEAREIIKRTIKQCLQMSSIPGNKKAECGNYRSHNLPLAKRELSSYLEKL